MSSHESRPRRPRAPPRLSVGFVARDRDRVLRRGRARSRYRDLHRASRRACTPPRRLKQQTLEMAIPTVTVIHPKRGAPTEEVALPGNAQAFVATPIYARTNGYLKTWYFDIGAHVKSGQLLAEIETPEMDRQLDQARADLATAQANYDLSQTTADRYQTLLKSDSVAKQDVEDRVGDLHAKKAMVDSAAFQRAAAGRDAALSESLRAVRWRDHGAQYRYRRVDQRGQRTRRAKSCSISPPPAGCASTSTCRRHTRAPSRRAARRS